jgi:methanogenesis imperfect marker protein 11
MADNLTPAEIRQRYGDLPYITPYERIVALVDEASGLVELHEYHARGVCSGGAAWEVYHYERTSPLVRAARREGSRNIFLCGQGRADLELSPGIAGAGLEEVQVLDGEVRVTYAGLAGGGVAATLCRGMAEGVISTTVHEAGGGAALGRATLRLPLMRKLVIGVDDTDDAKRGATWSTANEIAFELQKDGSCLYLGHVISQLFPENPFKTTNCCATAIILGASPADAGDVTDRFASELEKACFSDQCGMAVSSSVEIADELRAFSISAARRMVSLEHAGSVAARCGVELRQVTGERGLIGALAAIGAHEDPDAAVIPFAGEPGSSGKS